MAIRTLSVELNELYPWLFDELGFRLTNESFNKSSFGDSLVVLSSPGFQVRFLRDRGQVFCEVASPQSGWIDLSKVLADSGRKAPIDTDLRTVAECFRENYSFLKQHLARRGS